MCVSLLMLSVLWQHILTCCACVLCTVQDTVVSCTVHNIHTQQVKICRHNNDNINIDTHIGTRYVILAKHWMWLPDDGFMWTETSCNNFYNFNYFNNLRILHFVCLSWKIKFMIYLIFLVPCIMLYIGELSPTRCNNCVFYSQWLYSTCFGWHCHPSSGVQCCIWSQVSWLT
jgi:hypothetical protein